MWSRETLHITVLHIYMTYVLLALSVYFACLHSDILPYIMLVICLILGPMKRYEVLEKKDYITSNKRKRAV